MVSFSHQGSEVPVSLSLDSVLLWVLKLRMLAVAAPKQQSET